MIAKPGTRPFPRQPMASRHGDGAPVVEPSGESRHERMRAMLGRLLRAAEALFVVLAVFLFSHALVPLLLRKSGHVTSDLQEGNALMRNIFLSLQVLAVVFGMMRWREFMRALLAHRLTLALVALALASVLWSQAPDLTLRRSIALLGSTLVGAYLACRYPLRSLVVWVGTAFGLAAAMSLVLGVLVPDYGVSGGMWRGIYTHKNTLGQMMVLAAVVLFLLWKDATRHRWILLAASGVAALLVVLSTSTSALLFLIAFGALVPLYAALSWKQTVLVPVLCFMMVLGVGTATVLLAYSEALVSVFGKDLTLTGRTDIWEAVFSSILNRPWLGYGFSAFWLGRSGESAEVFRTVGYAVIHSHNGFIDIAADLGFVGLTLFLAGFASTAARA
ncbi:MAG: O-antigen ligase family protein, partial [Gemmatimonadetes bacterium]|nr:O-antigen ligase family protein [Gemmatimonadota bacterium]